MSLTSQVYDEQLRTDLQTQLSDILKQEPGLTLEAAMAKATKNILKENPFVPPEGDKCPINTLPDELLALLFERGVAMEVEASMFGDDEDEDDDYEVIEPSDSDADDDGDEEDEDEDGDGKGAKAIADGNKTRDGDKESKSRENGDEDDEDEDEDEEEEETELPFQVLVSHVCKRWRSIALDTPALWTLLFMEKGTPLDKHKAFIERAKTAPLGITIDCTFNYEFSDPDPDTVQETRDKELLYCLKKSLTLPDPSLPVLLNDPDWHSKVNPDDAAPQPDPQEKQSYSITEFSEILDLIIPRLQYWKGICVRVSDYRWMYLLLARLHQCGPAESLAALELYHYDDDDDNERGAFHAPHLAAKFTPFHGQAPLLRNTIFWGVHLDWDASLGVLKNVEDFNLAYHVDEVRPSYDTLQAILQNPNLKELSLSLSGPRGTEDDWRNAEVQPIHMSTLTNLTLRYHSPKEARSLLRFLDMPNITSLSLDYDEQDYSGFAKDLCKAPHGRLKSILSGLEKFKISGLPCNRRFARRIMSQIDNVKFLDLNCTSDDEMVFWEALVGGGPGEPREGDGLIRRRDYCPALETIKTSGIKGKKIKEFVEARAKAGTPLTRVLMSEKDDVDLPSERWLLTNVKEFHYFEPSDSEEEEELVDEEEEEEEEEDDYEHDHYAALGVQLGFDPTYRRQMYY